MEVSRWRSRLTERWRASARLQDVTWAASTFALGTALNLIGLTGVWTSAQVDRFAQAPLWWYTALLAAGCAAMLFKRRHPVRALSVGALMAVLDLLIGGSIAMVLVIFDLLFSAGQFATARARTVVTTIVFVLVGTASVVAGLATGDFRAAVFVGLQLTTLLFVPLWWAANLRQQRELGELAAERTAREAVHAERASMARDLHDVIAAHLATTAIHSGAALALPPETGRDRAALQAVRVSSLAALEEMRSMIMLLRAEGTAVRETAAAAGLDRLPELVAEARESGLAVDSEVEAIEGVPALTDHAAHRIVREALTNARKHAPGSRVRLSVSEVGDHVEVTVTNTLTREHGADHQVLGTGTGLVSMRERAALVGGELTAGREGERWKVVARLPLHAGGGA